jgi:hypothetical protein
MGTILAAVLPLVFAADLEELRAVGTRACAKLRSAEMIDLVAMMAESALVVSSIAAFWVKRMFRM